MTNQVQTTVKFEQGKTEYCRSVIGLGRLQCQKAVLELHPWTQDRALTVKSRDIQFKTTLVWNI